MNRIQSSRRASLAIPALVILVEALGLNACSALASFDDLVGAADSGAALDASPNDGSVVDIATPNVDGATADANGGGGSAYRAAILASAPRAYLRLGDATGAKTLRDETGMFAPDVQGALVFGVKGAIVNDDDTAIFFDGMTSGVVFGVPAFDFKGMAPWALEAWIKPKLADDTFRFIFSKNAYDSDGREEIGMFVYQGHATVERYGHGNYTGASADVELDAWSYVVGLFDGTHLTLYLDGAQQQSNGATDEITDMQAPFIAGAQNLSPDGVYAGVLDELAVYDRALSQQEIAHHYAVGRGP